MSDAEHADPSGLLGQHLKASALDTEHMLKWGGSGKICAQQGRVLTLIGGVSAPVGKAHPEEGLAGVQPLFIPPGPAPPHTHIQTQYTA